MIRRLALLTLVCAVAASAPALAQVHVDTGALDSLSPATPTTPADATPSRPKRVIRKPVKPAPPKPGSSQPGSSKPGPAPHGANSASVPAPVTIAPTAPPAAALPPPSAPPPARALPAPIIPMVPGAAGDVSSIAGGLRVTFGAGKSDMSPATVAALHSLGHAVASNPAADINIFAYAAGAADDPSTPRRLSLSRALAARAVLMSDDIASTRIYLHAMGSTPSAGPPDRVDVQLAGTPQAPPPAAPPGPAAAPRTP